MLYLNDVRRYSTVLTEPNNILGIEYLKALYRQNSLIRGVTIGRENSNHNDKIVLEMVSQVALLLESILKIINLMKLHLLFQKKMFCSLLKIN